MLNSFYSGVSGMKGFQTKLDVIGNNIANVNTVGFKKSRVVFQDFLSKNLAGANGPTNSQGGTNPMQIGLGTKVSTIDTVQTQGSPMSTNVGSDLSVDGEAYFVVVSPQDPNQYLLTKAGNFTLDGGGNLVTTNGYLVAGVAEDNTGVQQAVPIQIFDDEVSNQKFTSFSVDNSGNINVVREDGESGKLAKVMDPTDANFGKYYLNDETSNTNEIISIGTSVVTNPGGLQKVGNSMFVTTANSGQEFFGRIEDNAGGQINAGVLEMSNVDLTEEFTEMIVAQRGFQANARTITTSDSIMEEIVNLKR
ncbi:flagellar hook-basal body complex protein [Neobacillus jeddahensis]|uniref:flagellar hook-basal body complex protein n=1 Tax=Neobacillus jeddahensis TaxID=1461580 RepID=UPI00058D96C2|nr:flagellar hook-basal body complex protein [Neobacillus jeddahensis]